MYDSDAPALILSVRVPQSNPRPSARVRSCDREQTCGKDAPTQCTGHELNNTLAQDPSTLRVNQHHPVSSCLEQLVENLVQRVAGFDRVRLVGGWVVVCAGGQSAPERHDTAEETGRRPTDSRSWTWRQWMRVGGQEGSARSGRRAWEPLALVGSGLRYRPTLFPLPLAMVQASSSDSSARQQDDPLPDTVFDSASCNRRGSVPAPPLSPRSRARTWLTTLCPFEQVRQGRRRSIGAQALLRGARRWPRTRSHGHGVRSCSAAPPAGVVCALTFHARVPSLRMKNCSFSWQRQVRPFRRP